MALTLLKHGAMLDTVSRAEMRELLQEFRTRQQTRERVRMSQVVTLDANSFGTIDVYTVEPGWELEVRRVTLDINNVSEANLTLSVNLGSAGNAVQYLRSGTRIEWGNTIGPTSAAGRIPGIQTWGKEQGPYLSNGEVFQVRLLLSAAPGNTGATVTATMEGIITRGGSLK